MPVSWLGLRSRRGQLRGARAAAHGSRARRTIARRPDRGGSQPPLPVAQRRALGIQRCRRYYPGLKIFEVSTCLTETEQTDRPETEPAAPSQLTEPKRE